MATGHFLQNFYLNLRNCNSTFDLKQVSLWIGLEMRNILKKIQNIFNLAVTLKVALPLVSYPTRWSFSFILGVLKRCRSNGSRDMAVFVETFIFWKNVKIWLRSPSCVCICICMCEFVFVFVYLYLYLIMTTFCFGSFLMKIHSWD